MNDFHANETQSISGQELSRRVVQSWNTQRATRAVAVGQGRVIPKIAILIQVAIVVGVPVLWLSEILSPLLILGASFGLEALIALLLSVQLASADV